MYTDAGVHEALVDRLVNGVEHSVMVTALAGHPGVEGPASEPMTVTPSAAAGAADPAGACPPAGEPTRTHGVRVADCERGVKVTWRGAGRGVTQYRVVARVTYESDHDPERSCARSGCDRLYSSGTSVVFERRHLEPGREYGVTVTPLSGSAGGQDGATSEPACVVPGLGAAACAPDSAMMEARRFAAPVPTPAVPLAAAVLLAGLLAAAGVRRSPPS